MSPCPFARWGAVLRLTGRSRPAPPAESAAAFLDLLGKEVRSLRPSPKRKTRVLQEIRSRGVFHLTQAELKYGCQMAWRNSVRCIGRHFWKKLDLLDLRGAKNEEEVYAGCLQHLRQAFHGGAIRSTVTVFPSAGRDGTGPRIWNYQLSRYAGYRLKTGRILGDPMEATFTDFCLHLGWKPPRRKSAFDLLPLVISFPGRSPRLFPPPLAETVQIPIRHPDGPYLDDLDLRWYAVPAVANMLLEIAGLRFPAAPFSGWYMETEIGARNLADADRYNLLAEVARRFRLDRTRAASLWKDRALVELNRAVLHSFQKAGVRLMDHHSAAQSHLAFEQAEHQAGRKVFGRWDWLVPPLSGSTTPLWNRAYDPTEYSPNFLPQKPLFPFPAKS
jgi:nitric-oxide synthase